jgi:hypothetical protein
MMQRQLPWAQINGGSRLTPQAGAMSPSHRQPQSIKNPTVAICVGIRFSRVYPSKTHSRDTLPCLKWVVLV